MVLFQVIIIIIRVIIIIIIIIINRSRFANQRACERKSVGASPIYELNAA